MHHERACSRARRGLSVCVRGEGQRERTDSAGSTTSRANAPMSSEPDALVVAVNVTSRPSASPVASAAPLAAAAVAVAPLLLLLLLLL